MKCAEWKLVCWVFWAAAWMLAPAGGAGVFASAGNTFDSSLFGRYLHGSSVSSASGVRRTGAEARKDGGPGDSALKTVLARLRAMEDTRPDPTLLRRIKGALERMRRRMGPDQSLFEALARVAHLEGNDERAIEWMEKALNAGRPTPSLLIYLAGLHAAVGDASRAAFHLQRALEAGELTGAGHAAAAQVLLALGRWDEGFVQALEGLRRMRASGTVSAELEKRLCGLAALAALKSGAPARALRFYRRMVRIDPASIKGWLGLAAVYERLGEGLGLRRALANALYLARDDGLVRYLSRRLRELEPAYRYKTVEELRSEAPLASSPLLRAERKRDRKTGRERTKGERVREKGRRAARKGGGPKPRIEVPDLAAPPAKRNGGKREAAVRNLDLPLVLSDHMRLASLYERFSLFADARSEYETVINVSPAGREAEEAARAIRRLESLGPGVEGRDRLAMSRKVGWTLLEAGRYRLARLQFQKCLLENPSDVTALKALAYIEARAGRLEEASARLERALKLRPDDVSLLVLKGFVLARMRRYSEAYAMMRRASMLSTDPRTDAYVRRVLGRLSTFVELGGGNAFDEGAADR